MLDEELENMGPLDPRAGGIDVVLPQLNVDYTELADKLVQAGGQKSVRPKNRKLAYVLAKQFKDIGQGQYPLAVDQDDDREPAINKTDIDKAARRLLEFEEALNGAEKKVRKSKKARKNLAKKLAATVPDLDISETNGSESDNANSFYLEDSELLDHVGDNYMSYLEELHQNDEGKQQANNNGLTNGNGFGGDSEEDDDDESIEIEITPKKSKRRKLSILTNGTAAAAGEDTEEPKDKVTPLRRTLKQRKSLNTIEPAESSESLLKKKKAIKKRMSLPAVINKAATTETTNSLEGSNSVEEDGEGEKMVILRGKRKKSPKASKAPTTPATPSTPSNTKKRVSFVLARNLQHGKPM